MTIFISYNRKSRELASKLAEDLKRAGHIPWFDDELAGGQTWWEQILGKVRACDAFVFLMDKRSIDSAACRSEWRYAAALGKPILPVKIADGVSDNLLPPQLSLIQYVDYRSPDSAAAFRLAGALAGLPPAPSLPEPLPEEPEAPFSYLGTLAQRIESGINLSFDEQSSILEDLQTALAESTEDARALMGKLRKRRDLNPDIAKTIDRMLSPARNDDPPDPRPSPGADGKIAAICVWVVCALGLFIVWTTVPSEGKTMACITGASIFITQSCKEFPRWAALVLWVSVLGFGLGGRLWTRR